MKKFIYIFICLSLFVSCNNKKDSPKDNPSREVSSSSIKKAKKDVLEYPLDKVQGFSPDDSLYKNRMLGDFPENLKTASNKPYSFLELKNLDYNKNIYLSFMNIRIPDRAKIFKKDDIYYINFPTSKKYDISISLNKMYKDSEFSQQEISEKLFEVASDFTKKSAGENENLNISQDVFRVSSSYKDACISIIEDNKNTYTHLFLATPNNILHFVFTEDKEKSSMTSFIIADMLASAYADSQDNPIIGKDFTDYEKDVDFYADENISIDNFSFKISSSLKEVQKSDGLKVYTNEKDGNIINQLIIKQIKKDDKNQVLSIDQAFDMVSGDKIPPVYLVGLGKIDKDIVDDFVIYEQKIRMYSEQTSLEGYKIMVENENSFLCMIITGPLENPPKTLLLKDNIVNSLNKIK